MAKKILKILGIALVPLMLLSGCNNYYPLYKVDVQQGNIINEKQLSHLKLGMTKLEVKALLGVSMLGTESKNRWTYLYYYQPGYGDPTRKRIDLSFTQDKLSHFSAQ